MAKGGGGIPALPQSSGGRGGGAGKRGNAAPLAELLLLREPHQLEDVLTRDFEHLLRGGSGGLVEDCEAAFGTAGALAHTPAAAPDAPTRPNLPIPQSMSHTSRV